MKRIITLFAVLAMMTGLFATAASAAEHIPPHGHMLVLGVEFGPAGPTYRKCVDLANNQALRLNAHHAHLHFGRAGEAQLAAGHVVVPTTPFSGIRDCAHLAELFGPPTN